MASPETNASLDAAMNVEINNLAGPLCTITAKSSWSVYKLKEEVSASTGINPANQRLVYNGECLLSSATLGELFPASGAEIMLIRVQDSFVRFKYPYGCASDDLLVANMSVEEAKDRCSSLDECAGFTFNGASNLEESFEAVTVHFKKKVGFTLLHRSEAGDIINPSCAYFYVSDADIRQQVVNYLSMEKNRAAISLIQNREIIEDLVRRNFFAFCYVCKGLKDDPEIVMAAVMQNPQVLEHASGTQKSSKELILAAVKKNGLALKHAALSMRADKDVVSAAIEENPDSFRFAHPDLSQDKALVIRVVQRRGMMLRDVWVGFTSDRDVVLEAIRQNGDALKHASEDLRNDEELQNEAKQQKLRSKFK